MTKWWRHKKECLKLIRSFERPSQELFMPKFQYQNSTKWCVLSGWVKFIKTKVIFRCLKLIKFGSRNQMLFMFKFYYQNGKKPKKLEINFWLTKRDNERITDRDRFKGLHIGARGIINRDSFGDFKSGQYNFKSLREDGGGWGRGRYWKSV